MGSQTDDAEGTPDVGASEDTVDTEPLTEAPVEAIPSSRISRLWIRILPAIVVLAVILVFVFQNTEDVKVRLFTFARSMPLSVALLGAAALGALLVLALGSARIFQLRKQVRRANKDSRVNRSTRRGR